MTEVIVLSCLLLGLIVGAGLNVVIWRVPLGESLWAEPSRRPGCAHPIRARDCIPILSWFAMRGRCRDCGKPISRRYPMVEAVTAVLFALMAWRFGAAWELPAYLYLTAIGVALSSIDLEIKRLPDRITMPSYAALALLFLPPTLSDSEWSAYLRMGLGGLALFGFYLVALLIMPSGLGCGDVKLAGLLGMALGWLGWGVLAIGGFLGQLLAVVIAAALIAAKRIGPRTKIPFGPFMIAGAVCAVLFLPQYAVSAHGQQAATSRPLRFPDLAVEMSLGAGYSVKQSGNASVAHSRGISWSGSGRDP